MTVLRRVGTGSLDQVISSLSNLLLLILVARRADVESYGAVALMYSVLVFGLTVQRGSIGVLVSTGQGHRLHRSLILLMWAGALTVAAPAVVLALVADDHVGTAALLIAVAPLVVYPQDLLRYVAVARGQAGRALVSDGLWAGVLLVLLGVDVLGWRQPAASVVGIWLAAGAVSLGVLAVLLRWPGPQSDQRVEGAQWSTLRRLVPDALISSVVPLTVAALVSAVLGLGATAALRGAGTLVGPISLLMSAVALVVLPEIVRLSPQRRTAAAAKLSSALCLGVMVWGGALLLLPTAMGRGLLGNTWDPARSILPWTVVEYLFLAASVGPENLLRAQRKFSALLGIRAAHALAVLTGIGWLLPRSGIAGVAAFLAAAAATYLAMTVVVIVRGRRSLIDHSG